MKNSNQILNVLKHSLNHTKIHCQYSEKKNKKNILLLKKKQNSIAKLHVQSMREKVQCLRPKVKCWNIGIMNQDQC